VSDVPQKAAEAGDDHGRARRGEKGPQICTRRIIIAGSFGSRDERIVSRSLLRMRKAERGIGR
jgi:hypothetical protein